MTYRFFSPFPKHLQIRELLLRRIERDFEPEDQFPTEQAIAEEFGVTRKTVREALKWIENEGLIRRRRGQGTFVLKKPQGRTDSRVTGMTEHFAQLNQDTGAKLVEKGVIMPPADIQAALQRPPDEPVFRVSRLRYFEGAPLAFHECFIVLAYGSKALDCSFDQPSLMQEVEKLNDVTFHESSQRVEAAISDTSLATLLETRLGAPILVVTRYYWAKSNKMPAVVFRSHYRADRYYYSIDLTGDGTPAKMSEK